MQRVGGDGALQLLERLAHTRAGGRPQRGSLGAQRGAELAKQALDGAPVQLRRRAVGGPCVLRPVAGGADQRGRRAPAVGPLVGARDEREPLMAQPFGQACVALGITLLNRQRHLVPEGEQLAEDTFERVHVLLLLGDDEELHRGV